MLSLLLALLLLVSAAPSAFAAVTDATLSSAVTGTAKYIYTTTPAPQVGSIGGEWAVLGLARSGYSVPEIGYVPETMRSVTIPGGDFAVFQVPACKGADELGEAVRATWRYACEQWLPGSAYAVDSSRSAFEYYLGSDSRIYIPVKEKA